ERRLLAKSLDDGSLTSTTGRQRDLAVSVAFLRPAADRAAAVRALAATPALAQLPERVLTDLARSIASLYGPGAATPIWQPPRPDGLTDPPLLYTAEACRSVQEWQDHVLAVCGTEDPVISGHAARVLTRALSTPGGPSAGLDRVHQSLAALLAAHPEAYLPLLVSWAPARFAPQIAAVLQRRDPDTGRPAVATEVVARVDRELQVTGFTTSRTAIAVAVSRRLVDDTRPPGDPNEATGQAAHLVENTSLAGDPQGAAGHAAHLVALSRRL